MNKATIRLIFLLLLSVAAFGQKFGYINSEFILSQFEEFREAQSKLEVEGRKLEKQYYDMAATLDSMQQEYERQKFLMTESNRGIKENEMRRLAEDIQKFQVDKLGPQGEFYQKQQALADPVLKKINTAIKKVGEDGGYDFIFDTVAGNVLYAQDKFDLTDKVLKELQK
ncbi:MAG: OmpH family outer membrane protein [Candidatus Marinimicrobia bacterium]|nr:OmpH family outer membrane protein [Candidatus Neomarinimicrobiota bacterium]